MPLVRKCPSCGHSNPLSAACCENPDCRESLLRTEIREAKDQESDSGWFLISPDRLLKIPLPDGESVTVGREAAGSRYFASRHFVSRVHLKVRRTGGVVMVSSLAETNGTLLNNRLLSPGIPHRIREGDLLSLGAREGQAETKEAAYLRLAHLQKE